MPEVIIDQARDSFSAFGHLDKPLQKPMPEASSLNLAAFAKKTPGSVIMLADQVIGRVAVLGNAIALQLDDNAPKEMTITDFPAGMQISIETKNDIVLSPKEQTIAGLYVTANNLRIEQDLHAKEKIEINVFEKLATNASIKSDAAIAIQADEILHNGAWSVGTDLQINSKRYLAEKNSTTQVKQNAIFINETLEWYGEQDITGKLFCKANEIIVDTEMNCAKDCYIKAELMQLGSNAKFSLQENDENSNNFRELDINTLVLDEGSFCNISRANIILGDLENNAQLNISQSKIKTNQLEGNIKSTNNIFVTDNLLIADTANLELENCYFQLEACLDMNSKASIKGKNNFFESEYRINFLGKTELEDSTIKTSALFTGDQVLLQKTNVFAKVMWNADGSQAKNCYVDAASVKLKNNARISEASKIHAQLSLNSDAALIKDTVVDVEGYTYVGERGLELTHSALSSKQNRYNGSMHINDGSYCQAHYIQQMPNSKIIVDHSQVDSQGFYTQAGSQLDTKNGASLNIGSGLFEGKTGLKQTQFTVKADVAFSGKTTGEQVNLQCEGTGFFVNSEHSFSASQLQFDENARVMSALQLQQESTLRASTVTATGDLMLEKNSILSAKDLNVLRKFGLKHSFLELQNTYRSYVKSETEINHAELQVGDVYLQGRSEFQQTDIKSLKGILFDTNSHTTFHAVKLDAKEDISIEQAALLDGVAAEFKAKDLDNAGKVNINGIKADLATFNNSGELNSASHMQIKAQSSVTNTGMIEANNLDIQTLLLSNAMFAQIHGAESAKIQALAITNILGDISSRNSLSMSSLININALGFYRGYDVNVRSLVNLNAGLILPNLPKKPDSLWDLFSVSRFTSLGRMILMQFLPGYSSTISLASMAVPYVMQAGKGLKNSWYSEKNKDLNWYQWIEQLPFELYDDCKDSVAKKIDRIRNADATDMLPLFMDGMNATLTVSQLVQAISGLEKEWTEKKTPPVVPAPEKTKADEPFNFIDILTPAAEIAVKAFGPSITLDSSLSFNAGGIASANVIASSWHDTNYGIEGGWNFTGNYRDHGSNRGILIADHLTMTGSSFDNFGVLYGVGSAQFVFDDKIINYADAEMSGNKIFMRAASLSNLGAVDFNKGQMELSRLEQTSEGQMHLTKVQVAATDTDIKGQYKFEEQTSINSSTIKLDGQGEINQSNVTAAEILQQTGNLVGKETTLKGGTTSVDNANLVDGAVIGEKTLVIKNSNTLGTNIKGGKTDLSDSTFKGHKIEQRMENASEKTNSTETPAPALLPVDSTIEAGDLHTESVTMENMTVQATNMNAVATILDQSTVEVENHLSTKNLAAKNKTEITANIIAMHDNSTVNQSLVSAKKSLKQDGETNAHDSTFIAADTNLDGAKLTDCHVQGTDKLTLQHVNTLDTTLYAKDMDLSDATLKGREAAGIAPSENKAAEKTQVDTEKTEEQANFSEADLIATGRLTVKNVTMENMKMLAKEMDADQLKMQRVSAKVEKDLCAKNLTTEGAEINAGNTTLDENMIMRSSVLNSEDSITFLATAKATTDDVFFTAKNTISHQAQHEQTGTLTMNAQRVETARTSHIVSGTKNEASPNVVSIDADKGSLAGTMEIDHGVVAIKKLDNADDFIMQRGQSAKQIFKESLSVTTEGHRKLSGMLMRDCDLDVTADSIAVAHGYDSKHDLTLTATKGDIELRDKTHAKNLSVSAEHDVRLEEGAQAIADELAHIEAGNDLILNAKEETYRDKHGIRKHYTAATIFGGRGNAYSKGVGAIVRARGGKVKSDASTIGAIGDAIIDGKQGIEAKTRSHEYIAERYTKSKRTFGIKHSKKEVIKTDVDIGSSTYASTDGKVYILSEEDGVDMVGSNFVTKQGTVIDAKKSINLYGLKYGTKKYTKKTSLWGLNKSKKHESHEAVKTVLLADDGKSYIHSREGSILARDLLAVGKGSLAFSAKNGRVDLSTSKLKHHVKEKSRSISFRSNVKPIVKQIRKGDVKGLMQQTVPLFNQLEQLAKADDGVELAAAVANCATHSYNTVMAMQEDSYLSGIIPFMPTVGVGVNQSASDVKFETTGPGGIFKEHLSIEAQEATVLGMPIEVETMKVDAKKFSVEGHALESSYKRKSQSIAVDIGLTGDVQVSVSANREKGHAVHYNNAQVKVANKLELHVEEMNLAAANVSAGSAAGQVDKLKIESKQDEGYHRSQSASTSSMGMVSASEQKTDSLQVTKASSFHVRDDIKAEEFNVKELNLIAAGVTSDGHNGLAPEKLIVETLQDYSQTKGFGIAGNTASVLHALGAEKSESPTHLSTINISTNKHTYKAAQKATVYGEKGENEDLLQLASATGNAGLNTTTADGRQVLVDKSRNVSLDIPVEPLVQAGKSVAKAISNSPPETFVQAENYSVELLSKIEEALRKVEQEEAELQDNNDNIIITASASEEEKTVSENSVAATEYAEMESANHPKLKMSELEKAIIDDSLTGIGIGMDFAADAAAGYKPAKILIKSLSTLTNFVRHGALNMAEGEQSVWTPALVDTLVDSAVDMVSSLSLAITVPLKIGAQIGKPIINHVEKELAGKNINEIGQWLQGDPKRILILQTYAAAKFVDYVKNPVFLPAKVPADLASSFIKNVEDNPDILINDTNRKVRELVDRDPKMLIWLSEEMDSNTVSDAYSLAKGFQFWKEFGDNPSGKLREFKNKNQFFNAQPDQFNQSASILNLQP